MNDPTLPEEPLANITLPELAAFIGRHPYAVQASVSPSGSPQAAVIGIIAKPILQIFFDALDTSRKCQNLRRNPRSALVIGGGSAEECSVQYEGVADEPQGAELDEFTRLYFARFPD